MILINMINAVGVTLILIIAFFIGHKFMKKFKDRLLLEPKTIKGIWYMSFIMVASSPFIIPIKIQNQEQMRILDFGMPIHYIKQYTSHIQTENSFPITTTLINPWGHSITSNLNINILNFALSVICLYTVLHFTVYFLSYAKRHLWQ